MHKFGIGLELHAAKSDVAIGAEIAAGPWYTVVSLQSGAVLLEVKSGTFDLNAQKYFVFWDSRGNYLRRRHLSREIERGNFTF